MSWDMEGTHMDDTKEIQRLTLVLVQTLDLDIEHGLRVDCDLFAVRQT